MEDNKGFEKLENAEPEQVSGENAAEEKAPDNKKTLITVIVCALVIIVAALVAVFVIRGGNDKPTEIESKTGTTAIEIVTDESGEAVTDEQGETVTQIVTQGGSSSGSDGGSNGGSSSGNTSATTQLIIDDSVETTTSAKAEKRTLKLYVKTPEEGSIQDVLIIYVNGEEDSRYDAVLDGNEYCFETAEKYMGDVEVKVELEAYKVVTVNRVGDVYDSQFFVMPLNHVEQGEIE